jgi:hypothetical protein
VRVGVLFRSFGGMMRGMHGMSVCNKRMMSGFFVVAFFVIFCCLTMMSGRQFVVLGSRFVMFGIGFAGHCCSPCMRRSRTKTLARFRAGGVTLA